MSFTLPSLPYDYTALEPHIDEQTMHIHHDKHHQGYVNNLNAALENHANLQSKAVEDLLKDLSAIPEEIRTAVRNNGGGHANHTLFWSVMKFRTVEGRRVGNWRRQSTTRLAPSLLCRNR